MNAIVSSRVRWLALATGCLTGVAGSLGFTWSFAIVILPESRFANHPGAVAVTLVSVLLVALCDVAIVIEEVKLRRTQGEQKTEIVSVSNQIRWLAGVTGCVTAATFTFDYDLGLLSVFLVVGALVAGRFPRSGRDLIWFGAVVVSLSELPIAAFMLLIAARGGADPRVTAGASVSVLLMVWCDAALVTDAFRKRRARPAGKTN
jgi:hypothetical protein